MKRYSIKNFLYLLRWFFRVAFRMDASIIQDAKRETSNFDFVQLMLAKGNPANLEALREIVLDEILFHGEAG